MKFIGHSRIVGRQYGTSFYPADTHNLRNLNVMIGHVNMVELILFNFCQFYTVYIKYYEYT
jgi:hypothetical protein